MDLPLHVLQKALQKAQKGQVMTNKRNPWLLSNGNPLLSENVLTRMKLRTQVMRRAKVTE
jgi:hypothetical protein